MVECKGEVKEAINVEELNSALEELGDLNPVAVDL